ncbi:MAG: 50S ribosomal protein L22 [Candidatus Omnitrophota bacterium]
MIAKAEAKYVRISTRKTRLVVDLVRGKTVEVARAILDNTPKSASVPIKKVLDSAFANANFKRQEKLFAKDVMISTIMADGAYMLKRFRAATMGRAAPIRHRTTHIRIELDKAVVSANKNKKVKSGSK